MLIGIRIEMSIPRNIKKTILDLVLMMTHVNLENNRMEIVKDIITTITILAKTTEVENGAASTLNSDKKSQRFETRRQFISINIY